MAEKKTTGSTKTASKSKNTKTTQTKKATASTSKTSSAEKAPQKQYTAQTMIPCRSVRQGILFYKTATGAKYQWEGYGDIREMPYEEVRSMLVSRSKFLFEPWLLIDDEELMATAQFQKALGEIKAAYDDFDDPEDFFMKPVDEIREKLTTAPNGLKEFIAYNAHRYINDGTLDRVSVVRIIDEVLGTDLKMMM